MKSSNNKPFKPVHTARSKIGMGDSYGSGVKNKVGRIIGDTMGRIELTPAKLKKPPRTLA